MKCEVYSLHELCKLHERTIFQIDCLHLTVSFILFCVQTSDTCALEREHFNATEIQTLTCVHTH
jgi:hypothetical protein